MDSAEIWLGLGIHREDIWFGKLSEKIAKLIMTTFTD